MADTTTKTPAVDTPNSNYSTFDEASTVSNNNATLVTVQPKPLKIELRFPEQQETEKWKFRLFGCMEDKKLCLGTFCCPYYTAARNAEYFYEDGTEVGVAFCLGGCVGIGSVMRWRLRQHKKIEGNMLKDVFVHTMCSCCALIQENREIYGTAGSHAVEELEARLNEE